MMKPIGPAMSRLRLASGALALLFGLTVAGAGAANAPATPEASACTIAPITIEHLQNLAAMGASPVASPALDTTPSPADIDGITQTIEESVACTNANQPLRALALFSDRYLAARFSGAGADDLGHLTAAVTRSPAPAQPADRLAIVSISAPKTLVDGRVSVIVKTSNSDQEYADVLVFVNVDGRWLIDETHPATPGGATPASQG
jgi:hypothetical protein